MELRLKQTEGSINLVKNDLAEKQAQLDNATKELQSVDTYISLAKKDKENIDNEIKNKTEYLEKGLAARENSEKELLANRLAMERKKYDDALAATKEQTELRLREFNASIEDARGKWQSIVESLRKSELIEEQYMLHFEDKDMEDINYLLAAAEKVRKPDVFYKFIWQEYVQKPTNEMLNHILPDKDCSGIYRITNVKTKASYIGRSTCVHKRIGDHIKSAIGITTIADQSIHRAMRKEGLNNFKFELLEECPREKLGEREKFYIEYFATQKWGYNSVAGSNFER